MSNDNGVLDWKTPNVVQQVDMTLLDYHPLNPRRSASDERMKQLIESIIKEGVFVPVGVTPCPERENVGLVFDGNRRLFAARKAGCTRIPALLDPRELGEKELLVRLGLRNEFREDLNPVDRGNHFIRLQETGMRVDQIAATYQVSTQHVEEYMRIPVHLSDSAQRHVATGAIPATTAITLTRFPEAKRDRYASQLISGQLDGKKLRLKRKRSF